MNNKAYWENQRYIFCAGAASNSDFRGRAQCQCYQFLKFFMMSFLAEPGLDSMRLSIALVRVSKYSIVSNWETTIIFCQYFFLLPLQFFICTWPDATKSKQIFLVFFPSLLVTLSTDTARDCENHCQWPRLRKIYISPIYIYFF